MAQHGGAADSYYNNAQPPMQYQSPQQPYNAYQQQQPPPSYGQNGPNGQNYQNTSGGDGKQTFEQAFKLNRPKYNDLWAGILVYGSERSKESRLLT